MKYEFWIVKRVMIYMITVQKQDLKALSQLHSKFIVQFIYIHDKYSTLVHINDYNPMTFSTI